VNTENRVGTVTVLFWLLAPVLYLLAAGPLFLGHVAVRLLIAGMRRPRVERQRRMPSMREVPTPMLVAVLPKP
jgi:hypothetical protein